MDQRYFRAFDSEPAENPQVKMNHLYPLFQGRIRNHGHIGIEQQTVHSRHMADGNMRQQVAAVENPLLLVEDRMEQDICSHEPFHQDVGFLFPGQAHPGCRGFGRCGSLLNLYKGGEARGKSRGLDHGFIPDKNRTDKSVGQSVGYGATGPFVVGTHNGNPGLMVQSRQMFG